MDVKALKDIPPWDWPEGTGKMFLDILRDDQAAESERPCAAGTWEVDAAWPHITALVTWGETDKPLLLAAIEAVASIRPQEAAEILDELTDSDDEDIVEAVFEATAMAGRLSDEDDELRH